MYAQFIKDHYQYYCKDTPSPLNDGNHIHLFNYLSFDLSKIEGPLSLFLDNYFDFAKMRLKEDRPKPQYDYELEKARKDPFMIIDMSYYEIPNERVQEMLAILTDSHPYYLMGMNAIEGAESIIVDGFNRKASESEYIMDENEYRQNIGELLRVAPLFVPISSGLPFISISDENVVRCYYRSYTETYETLGAFRRAQSKGIPVDPPQLKILEDQKLLKRFVAEVLSFSDDAKSGKKKRLDHTFHMDLTVDVIDGVLYEKYSVGTLNQLLECEVVRMAIAKTRVKVCKCCGRFFVSDDNRRNYCDRLVKDGKTCADIGPNKTFWAEKKNDSLYNAYRKARSKNAMRLSRGVITGKQFKHWQQTAEAKRKQGADDYYDWLSMTIYDIREKCNF